MGFPRQEYWSGFSFISAGDLPDPRIKPTSPAWAGRFFTTEPLRKSLNMIILLEIEKWKLKKVKDVSVSNYMGDRNGLQGLCNSSLPGLDTYCGGLGNAVHSILLVTQMRANRRGERKAVRDGEAEWESASKFKCCWNAEEMASPNPGFPQGLSKLLSKTLDYSYLGGNLEMRPSFFSGKMPNSLYLLATAQHLCVWKAPAAFQKCLRTRSRMCCYRGLVPTATQPGETGFLDTEMGVEPPSFCHINTILILFPQPFPITKEFLKSIQISL